MRLWILSDLHVELTRGWDLAPPVERPRFDILVVAGDLIPRAERGVRWLLERVPDNPRPTLLTQEGRRTFANGEIDGVELVNRLRHGTRSKHLSARLCHVLKQHLRKSP